MTTEKVRTFDSGANRSSETGKLDYEGFLSPLVIERYAQYLHEHRTLPDGTERDSDNWQKGMPLSVYMKSAWRHFHAWWKIHRRKEYATKDLEDAICALIFNASGYLHEHLKVWVVRDDGGHPVIVPPRRSNREIVEDTPALRDRGEGVSSVGSPNIRDGF